MDVTKETRMHQTNLKGQSLKGKGRERERERELYSTNKEMASTLHTINDSIFDHRP